jgi:hypothetical protein
LTAVDGVTCWLRYERSLQTTCSQRGHTKSRLKPTTGAATVVVGTLNSHLADAAWDETTQRAKENLKKDCGNADHRCSAGAVFTARAQAD